MSAPVPPGAPRPGNPPPGAPFPNYNPNLQRGPDQSLAQNFQNLNINQQPNALPSPSPMGVPPFRTATPPTSFPGFSTVARPGPPPAGVTLRPPVVAPGSQQFVPPVLPPNITPGRSSSGPLPSQPPSFSTRPPQGSLPMGLGSIAPPPGAIPSGAPSSQAVPPPPVAGSSGFGSPPLSSTPVAPPMGMRPYSNGPPTFTAGPLSGPPCFPSSGSVSQSQSGPAPTMATIRTPAPTTTMRSILGNESPTSSVAHPPPFGSSQSAPMFAAPAQVQQQPLGPPSFGAQPWQTQQQSPLTVPSIPPSTSTYGLPGSMPNQAMATMPHALAPTGSVGGPNKIDPNQIPRPIPSSSITIYETRQNYQANPPPPATSEYIVRDMGNCSPRYMRCTINQIPCTADLLTTSGMQLALLVQPLCLPHPSEEPVQVVDFGERGPVRCSRCKAYINPFMKFIDQGRQFICNLCGFTDETPRDYHCNLGPDGRRRDADERPELCWGTVEFIATKEYMVRDPMHAVIFFLVDVSMNAIKTGATAAACSAINQVIDDLPEGPSTKVGIATFDSTIHFYNLKRALQQPLMLIVPDIQDVYTPLESDVIVQLSECRQHLELLLENIPTMFQNNKTADSAFGAAIKASFLAMKNVGGKLLVFQAVLPSVGLGALSAREAEGRANISSSEKEAHKLLQPADKILKEMAIEFAEYQVCVDVFITSQSYVDIASISVVPKTTGGQVYYYYPFSAISDTAKLYNDLRWNVTRPQGFEAVMRVRCSQGVQVQEYFGNYCKRIPTDVDLAVIDCDKTIMVTLKHDDKLQEGTEVAFQCALLYTTFYGQRRIRVNTLSLPCTSTLANLFRSADLDTQFSCFLKQAANDVPTTSLSQVREQITTNCINILHSYRKFCATVSSSGQLILPEALKLLPLYTLGLIKSTGLKADGRIDDRSVWINYVSFISASLAVPLVYPRLISVHDLASKETDESIPTGLPLKSEQINDDGVYLLENGIDALIYVGGTADPEIVSQLFGTHSVDEIPNQFVLEQYENPLSKKLNEVMNEIRRQRCSYLRLKVCKKGDQSGVLFFSYMVEDKTPTGLSYVEFLIHIHRQIQSKIN